MFFFIFCINFQLLFVFFFFQAEDGIRDIGVTGVQTCALPIYPGRERVERARGDQDDARPLPREPDRRAAGGGAGGTMTRADESYEPQKIQSIDAEFLSGERFPYQEDIALVEGIDLEAATPGQDINWLEDIELLIE